MRKLAVLVVAAALAIAPHSAEAQRCVGSIGPIPMNGTFAGTIERGRACWDATNKYWWQEKTFDVARDTTVWLFFSATDDVNVVVTDWDWRVQKVGSVAPRESGRKYGSMTVQLRRGTYRLQIQAARLGTRYTARPHYGWVSLTATGLCDRASAPALTSNPAFTFPLSDVAPGVALACIDPHGRAAVIRSFTLDAPTDVGFELRARDRQAKSAIHLSGPGHRDAKLVSVESPKPGDPARLTLPLGRGTYYVVLASDAETTIADASVRKTPSMTTAPLPTARNPACADLTRLSALPPGQTVAGRLTVAGSCGRAAVAGLPAGLAEVYRLSIPQRATVAVEVESRSFAPVVVVFNAREAAPIAVETNAGAELSVRVPVTLEPGEYLVTVGHARPTEIGSFELTVDPD